MCSKLAVHGTDNFLVLHAPFLHDVLILTENMVIIFPGFGSKRQGVVKLKFSRKDMLSDLHRNSNYKGHYSSCRIFVISLFVYGKTNKAVNSE